MKESEFNEYYAKYQSAIRGIARKLAGSDDAMHEDLMQEGWLAISTLDVSNAKTNKRTWMLNAAKYRMLDWLRYMSPARYDSLDDLLAHGDQVEADPSTGDLRLFTSRKPIPQRLPDDEENRRFGDN